MRWTPIWCLLLALPLLADEPTPAEGEPVQFRATAQKATMAAQLPMLNYDEETGKFKTVYQAVGKPSFLFEINSRPKGGDRAETGHEMSTALDDSRLLLLRERIEKPFLDSGVRLLDGRALDIEAGAKPDILVRVDVNRSWAARPKVSGNDEVIEKLEIVATAIRTGDAAKLAQISSTTLFGDLRSPELQIQYDKLSTDSIIEQVALAIMRDFRP